MSVEVILIDENKQIVETNIVEYVDNKDDFTYVDDNDAVCRIKVFSDGLLIRKSAFEYELELSLRNEAYTKVVTTEGEIQLDTKVVDFIQNDDILVMRYLIDNEKKEIKINYRS